MSTPDKTAGHSTSLSRDNSQAAGYQIIMNYESLSALTGQMRDAAMRGEWDKLVDLEKQRSQQVTVLEQMNEAIIQDESTRQRKLQLIEKILADDTEIRNRTETWMGQLKSVMQSNRQEQHLQQTYGGV